MLGLFGRVARSLAVPTSGKTSSSGISPSVASMRVALGLTCDRASRRVSSAGRSTRSPLLMATRSAARNWLKRRGSPRSASADAASATHNTVSSGASRQMTGSIRLRMMSSGSATPLVSITMASGRGLRRSRLASVRSKSPSSEQQMQPLARLMTPLSAPAISSASILIAPKSLTTAAMRRPSACCRMRLTSVVLPAPRKPVTSRIGTCMAVRLPRRRGGAPAGPVWPRRS